MLTLTNSLRLNGKFDSSSEKIETEYIANSASETALACDFDKPGVLSIGSLISFRKATQPEHKRMLGVVNKISIFKGSGKLQFGIILLTAQPHVVMFSELRKTNDIVKQKALIYNIKMPGEEEKSFLIVDLSVLKDADVVRLYLNDQDFPILLRMRKNIGLGYWQFDCRRVDEQELARMTNKGYDFT